MHNHEETKFSIVHQYLNNTIEQEFDVSGKNISLCITSYTGNISFRYDISPHKRFKVSCIFQIDLYILISGE